MMIVFDKSETLYILASDSTVHSPPPALGISVILAIPALLETWLKADGTKMC